METMQAFLHTAKEDARLRVLGVFAHPDDETFCAGGTLAKLVAEGAEAMVVSFTRGDAGQIRDPKAASRQTLGKVREEELRQASKRLGVQHVECLDYGDGELKEVDFRTLVGEVARIIRTFRPHVVLTFGRDGAYGHPDHIAISLATSEASSLAGDAQEFPEQIDQGLFPHTPSLLYQCRFPRNQRLLMDSLVKWLASLDAPFCGTLDFIQGLKVFAAASATLGFSSDHINVEWFPPASRIIEQDEPSTSLYLILSGHVEVVQEDNPGEMRRLGERGPGEFFGETELANGRTRDASVSAIDGVTCLVFSPGEPTVFAGRGPGAMYGTVDEKVASENSGLGKSICLDVSEYVQQKLAAVAAHRSQYHIAEDTLPEATLREMLDCECFVPVHTLDRNQDRELALSL